MELKEWISAQIQLNYKDKMNTIEFGDNVINYSTKYTNYKGKYRFLSS